MKIFFSFIICLFMLLNIPTQAQECTKAKLKTNRNKVLLYKSYTAKETYSQALDLSIRKVLNTPEANQDSIYISQDDKLIQKFSLKNYYVQGNTSVYYYHKGKLLIDSIVDRPIVTDNTKYYYNGLFKVSNVFATIDKSEGSTMFFDSNGNDSLWMVMEKNNMPLSKTWYQKNGLDSVLLKWNNNGQLIYEKSDIVENIWSDDGRLLQHSFDTIIQKKKVKCHKSFFNSGAVSSITFTRFGVECLTWKYYNEKGKLVRTINHVPLNKTPYAEVVSLKDRSYPTYFPVEARLNCEKVFNTILNQKLIDVLCTAEVSLNGLYQIAAYVDKSGKFVFIDVDGENAEAVNLSLMKAIDDLPLTYSFITNGEALTQKINIILEVVSK